jgi:cytochrome c553
VIRALVTLSFLGAVFATAPAWAQKKPPQADLEQCARCHGDEGIARDTEVPNLAGQNEAYLVNQLRAFRSGARRHPDMRFMSRTMTDAEIEAYAAYYTALKP